MRPAYLAHLHRDSVTDMSGPDVHPLIAHASILAQTIRETRQALRSGASPLLQADHERVLSDAHHELDQLFNDPASARLLGDALTRRVQTLRRAILQFRREETALASLQDVQLVLQNASRADRDLTD